MSTSSSSYESCQVSLQMYELSFLSAILTMTYNTRLIYCCQFAQKTTFSNFKFVLVNSLPPPYLYNEASLAEKTKLDLWLLYFKNTYIMKFDGKQNDFISIHCMLIQITCICPVFICLLYF